jgi:hypothetical protein
MFPDLFKHSKRKNRIVAEVMVNEAWIHKLMHCDIPTSEMRGLVTKIEIRGVSVFFAPAINRVVKIAHFSSEMVL